MNIDFGYHKFKFNKRTVWIKWEKTQKLINVWRTIIPDPRESKKDNKRIGTSIGFLRVLF